jgi:hypothetical protein
VIHTQKGDEKYIGEAVERSSSPTWRVGEGLTILRRRILSRNVLNVDIKYLPGDFYVEMEVM